MAANWTAELTAVELPRSLIHRGVPTALKNQEANALAGRPLRELTVSAMAAQWIAEVESKFWSLGIELLPGPPSAS